MRNGLVSVSLILCCVFSSYGQQIKAPTTGDLNSLRLRAERGNPEAQFTLSSIYYEGNGVRQDFGEAASWMRKAAEQGYAKAEFTLGKFYQSGEGVPQDFNEAMHWLRRSLEHGNFNAAAVFGVMYQMGIYGVTNDYKESFRWFLLAAEQGVCVAQHDVARIYEEGTGVAQDYSKVARWYRRAADQGMPYSQFNLGVMLRNGQGVPQDYVSAHMWINLAASGVPGDKSMQYAQARDVLAAMMTPEQVGQAQRLASAWKPRAENNSTCKLE